MKYVIFFLLGVWGLSEALPDLQESEAVQWTVDFGVDKINTTMLLSSQIQLRINNIPKDLAPGFTFRVLSDQQDLLHLEEFLNSSRIFKNSTSWQGNVSMQALFLGHANVYVELLQSGRPTERAADMLPVIILRNEGAIDTAFRVFVGCFVMVLYVHFGAAVDVQALKQILLCPVGPLIGFVAKFVMMPLLGYTIGYVFFRDQIELRLGLFFTSVTPAGGSSNIFTALFDGNLNLSVTMTALSNLAAFFMMPVWLFTLGALIFHDGHFVIPYATIATTSCSLVVPLSIGIALQKYAPNFVGVMNGYLKTFALALIIVVMIIALWVNSFMFRLFSLKIILAGACLSWMGYVFGWLMARLFRQNYADSLAIAIETGIENTGIAIFMLNFTLPQPQADITSAVPVANSFMTPMPLLLVLLLRKCFCRREEVEDTKEEDQLSTKEVGVNKANTVAEVKAIRQQAKADLKAP